MAGTPVVSKQPRSTGAVASTTTTHISRKPADDIKGNGHVARNGAAPKDVSDLIVKTSYSY